MKNWIKGLIVGTALLSVAAPVMAAQLTSYFYIQNLDAITSSSGGYAVYARSYTIPNPAGCPNTGKAEVYTSSTAVDKDLMNRTLLAAFMAGRQVRLSISQNACSVNNYPAYHMVRLDADG
jgi:hypothetical protein